MSKKTSGLGRGLGDLLEDNAPEIRSSGTVVRRDAYGEVSVSPEKVGSAEIIHSTSMHSYREAQVYMAVTPISAKSESFDASEPWQSREELVSSAVSASDVSGGGKSEETIPDTIKLAGESVDHGAEKTASDSSEDANETENVEKNEISEKNAEALSEEPVRRTRSLKAIFREFK